MTDKSATGTVDIFSHRTHKLFPEKGGESESILTQILSKQDSKNDKSTGSQQGANRGRKEHPFDMEVVTHLKPLNVHHSACIGAKVSSTVGLGFETEADRKRRRAKMEGKNESSVDGTEIESNVDKELNPLCDISFQDIFNSAIEDYWQVGNGYIEIVRAGGTGKTTSSTAGSSQTKGDEITGIHHIQAPSAYLYVEDEARYKHFELQGTEGSGTSPKFALFGDREGFIRRNQDGDTPDDRDKGSISEVIWFRQPSSLTRWYGFPDWLAAVASIELVQMILQHKYDFFLNRGVPEFLLFVLGQKVGPDDWEKITDVLRSNIGMGNSHKSGAINLVGEDIEVQLERLAMDAGGEDDFAKTKENQAVDIVSAHRVPPLLAGIQIPGKLGANNELPNALAAFQLLVIGPAQVLIRQQLTSTLGNKELNGGLKLTPDDFVLRKITNELDLETMDTVGRMRETVPEAKAKGRDLGEGVKN